LNIVSRFWYVEPLGVGDGYGEGDGAGTGEELLTDGYGGASWLYAYTVPLTFTVFPMSILSIVIPYVVPYGPTLAINTVGISMSSRPFGSTTDLGGG
jgi:hypothetical protein